MSNSKITDKLAAKSRDEMMLKVLEILESEDGKTFKEKKENALAFLEKYENTVLEYQVTDVVTQDETGRCAKQKFWSFGEEIYCGNEILLRRPLDEDRTGYIQIQKEYSPMRGSIVEESYYDMMWKEHIESKSLMCAIVKEGEYVGYCGIKNTGKRDWEIAIELLRQWTHKGIGFEVLSIFLKEVKCRLGKMEFRVRISADNYVIQRLFEKLGAVPNGISEFLLHDKETLEQCEEENLHLIDDRMRQLAERFKVEPRKLLSHILEYRLEV